MQKDKRQSEKGPVQEIILTLKYILKSDFWVMFLTLN